MADIPTLSLTVPARGDALVAHVEATAPAGTRVFLTIDGKVRDDAGIVFKAHGTFGFSVVMLLEPGVHVVSLEVTEGEAEMARVGVEVLHA